MFNQLNQRIMKEIYKVWADSESHIEMPMDVVSVYDDLDTAYDVACTLAHEHDDKPYWAIFHVEDLINDETIETVENIPNFDAKKETKKTYDYFLEVDGLKYGLVECGSFMSVRDVETNKCVGTIQGLLKNYKNNKDAADVDLSNINDAKLIENIVYLDMEETEPIFYVKHCPFCGSENIEDMTDAFDDVSGIPNYHCHNCDTWFKVS